MFLIHKILKKYIYIYIIIIIIIIITVLIIGALLDYVSQNQPKQS